MTAQPIQPIQQVTGFDKLALLANYTGVVLPDSFRHGYAVSIANSIARILTTRIGERVMRPTFGSQLYLLRDREFNSTWRLLATRFVYEAISRWEPRVRFKRLRFVMDSLGQQTFYIELDPND